jgi:hypothetical protein
VDWEPPRHAESHGSGKPGRRHGDHGEADTANMAVWDKVRVTAGQHCQTTVHNMFVTNYSPAAGHSRLPSCSMASSGIALHLQWAFCFTAILLQSSHLSRHVRLPPRGSHGWQTIHSSAGVQERDSQCAVLCCSLEEWWAPKEQGRMW